MMIKRKKRKSMPVQSQNKSDGVLDSYMHDIKKIPLLSREEEQKIAREAGKGNKAAQDKLINANLRFVIRIAKKYQGQGLPLEDLISEGNVGLLKALKHYDPDRGFHFISYAVWWIRQSILMAIAEKSRFIRIPMHWNSKLIQIEKSRMMVTENQISGNEITEMAEQLGMEPEILRELMLLRQDTISLEHPVNMNGTSSQLGDFLEGLYDESPEEHALNQSLQDEIEKVLDTLSSKEAEVIRARYGLVDGIPKSLEEIGVRYNMSKERIRQIENTAIDLLRQPSRSRRLESYIAS